VTLRIAGALLLLGSLATFPASGARGDAPEKVAATAGPEYGAGPLHRFLFGSSYRKVWTTPAQADVLDLGAFAGGLTPVGTGGGKQTLSLHFKGADGRPYTFRALNKDPGETLPEELRGTAVHDLYKDQISSSFPTGHVTVPVFLDALGLLHAEPRLVVLPDDPRLGEWRAEFAGQVGMIEEWPNEGPGGTPGFAGATAVISTDELQDTLRADAAQRMVVEEYLTGRLLDVTIGDWDRHRGQWRWANTGPGNPPAWRPIPEDRDQAYVRYDGFMLSAAREYAPQLVKFGKKFPRTIGATWNGRDIDRAFLGGVSWETWEERAGFVQAQLTDAVIDSAVHRLPQAHYDLAGEDLTEALRARRDHLPEFARSFYEQLAHEVEVPGTDAAELYQITRRPGETELTVTAEGASEPRLHRVYKNGETSEIRIHPGGGDDRVVVDGEGGSGIRIRVVDVAGHDDVQNRSGEGKLTVYDSRAAGAVVVAGADVNRKPYTEPEHSGALPPRDWGSSRQRRMILGGSSEFGLVIGAGVTHRTLGFRKDPFAREIDAAAAWATGQQSGKLQFRYTTYAENSHAHGMLTLFASGIEIVRYYGLGNETPDTGPEKSHQVEQPQVFVEPAFGTRIARDTDVEIGLGFRYSDTRDVSGRLISEERPYGFEDMQYLKLRGQIEYDAGNGEADSPRGLTVTARGAYTPDLLGVEHGAFGSIGGGVTGRVSAGKRLTLVLEGAGEKVFGTYPYQEAAYIGGLRTVRGFPSQRYGGDASVYGRATLEVALVRFFLLLPNDFGIVMFSDTGRVFLEDEDSSRWHPGFGGGVWIAPVDRRNAAFFLVGVSDEATRFYFRLGGY